MSTGVQLAIRSPGMTSIAARLATDQVRSFLHELTGTTRKFAQLSKLEDEVSRQYRKRVAVELLQNAHDALPPTASEIQRGTHDGGASAAYPGSRRILFKIAQEDDEHFLYVANDGMPLDERGVTALAQVGLSSKSPADGVGNKGVGFRCVLTVSSSPQVFSRSSDGSVFDGHSFRFDPAVHERIWPAIEALMEGDDEVVSPFDGSLPLVADPGQANQIRTALKALGREAVRRELLRLSYLALPVPFLPDDHPDGARRLAGEGYSTVVRLPLTSADVAEDVADQLQTLVDPATVLFIERVGRLKLKTAEHDITIRRHDAGPAPAAGQRVVVDVGGEQTEFLTWTDAFGGAGDDEGREALQRAVDASNLPDVWGDVDHAHVTVAVEASVDPRPGLYSIFLPTEAATGTSAFANAPFYGDLDRRSVDPTIELNGFLLGRLDSLASRVLVALGEAPAAQEVAAIRLAIVAPSGGEDVTDGLNLHDRVCSALAVEGKAIENVPLLLTSMGWAAPSESRILPDIDADVLTAETLACLAPFPVVLGERGPAHRLYRALGLDPKPTSELWSKAVGAVAELVMRGEIDGDWGSFYQDLESLSLDRRTLAASTILPTSDGRLLAPNGDDVTVFFLPRARTIREVPTGLQNQMAFLSDAIPLLVQVEKTRRKTQAREFLAPLVNEYNVDAIVRDVVLDLVPPEPIPLGSDLATQWRDIFRWVEAVTSDRSDADALGLGGIPVPCHGGWHPAADAVFGPGWTLDASAGHDPGADLVTYIEAAGTASAHELASRLVLPPDHEAWGAAWSADDLRLVLKRFGVTEGLPLLATRSEDPDLYVRGWSVEWPDTPPQTLTTEQWSWYTSTCSAEVRKRRAHASDFPYEMGNLVTVAGLDGAIGSGKDVVLPPSAAEALSRLLLRGLDTWPSTWDKLTITKKGGDRDVFSVPSPLLVFLRTSRWLRSDQRAETPATYWVLPSSWTADLNRHQYDYLPPIPNRTSERAASRLQALGCRRLPEDVSGEDSQDVGAFLERVADAVAAYEASDIDLERHARWGWRMFDEDESEWPERMMALSAGGNVCATPSLKPPCYIPSESVSNETLVGHGHLVVVADPESFPRPVPEGMYGGGLRDAAALRVEPFVSDELWDQGGEPLLQSPVRWAAEIAATAFAFKRPAAKGAHTKAFAEAADRLRGARVAVVDELTSRLVDEGLPITEPADTDALWDPTQKTLLVRRTAPPTALADPLAEILKWGTYRDPLRLALTTLTAEHPDLKTTPSEGLVANAFAALRLGSAHRGEVESALHGDVAWAAKMIAPLFLVLRLHERVPTTSVAAIETAIGEASLEPLSASDVAALCRSSTSFAEAGWRLFERGLDAVSLREWNRALASLGELLVSNPRAEQEVASLRRQIAPLARAALANASSGDRELYHPGLDAFDPEPPPDLDTSYWRVPIEAVSGNVADALEALGVSAQVAETFRRAHDVSQITDQFVKAGIRVSDPAALREENRRLGLFAAGRLAAISAAHAELVGGTPTLRETINEAVGLAVEHHGPVDAWDKSEALRRVAFSLDSSDSAVVEAQTAEDETGLLAALGLTAEDVGKAEERVAAAEREAEAAHRAVDVAGRSFADVPDQQKLIFDFLVESASGTVDLESPERIPQIEPWGNRERKLGPRAPKSDKEPRRRGTKKDRQLVGDVGEMRAYLYLKETYGDQIVSPSSWVSKARSGVFGSGGDDDLGYDLVIQVREQLFYIEVKSTAGNDSSFEMGSSEVEAARQAAKDGIPYRIVRVEHALSDNPAVHVLPNPFGDEGKGRYRVKERGAYLRYKR